MKINKKLISALLLLFLCLLQFNVLTQPVRAQALSNQIGLNEVSQKFGANGVNNVSDIRVIAVQIINISLGLLSMILVALLIFSGYQWMTAGGNEEQIDKARKRIINAVIGLLIVVVSWSVAYLVLKRAICVTGAQYSYPMCTQNF